MRIAVPVISKSLKSTISPVFGRSNFFLIAEVENAEIKKCEVIENSGAFSIRGAGIATSQLLLSKKVDAVITISIGPSSLILLESSGVKVYQGFQGSAEENIKAFLEGKLSEIRMPTRGRFRWRRGWGWRW